MRNVGVAILALLISTSALITPAARPAEADPGVVMAAGTRLVRSDGSPFFVLGVNYVGAADRSWTMWQDGLFDVSVVERDFLRAKAAGANTVRIFVRPPLQQQVAAGQWSRLDSVIGLAERHGLQLIITLYDYREDDLSKVAAVDRAIASRYANRRCILAYDLRNEPHYQNLAVAQYPGGQSPLQTEALIQRYGQQMTQQEVDAWRQTDEGRSIIPGRFSSREAYMCANNYRIYLQLVKEAGDWVTARNYEVSTLDYLQSPDAVKWKPLLDVLDQTLAAWLKPQIEAVRSGDPQRLVTVGYSDAILASLSANKSLGFISFHRFPNSGLKPLRVLFEQLDDFQRLFADKPLVLEEFGYSNASLEPSLTSQYETAIVLHLLSQGMAGAAKWSLYDVTEGWDAQQMNYGLFGKDGGAKPVVAALQAVGEHLVVAAPARGEMTLDAEPAGPGITYVYSAPGALCVAARAYADGAGRLAFEASTVAQVFAFRTASDEVSITTTSPVVLRVNVGPLIGEKVVKYLSLKKADGTSVPFDEQGDGVVFTAGASETYRLKFRALSVDARIEIVWPHGNQPVSQAEQANVGVNLFELGTDRAICPELTPTVRLWRALNNDVEEEVAVGVRRAVHVDGLWFNVWDFNNVDVSAAKNEASKYYFRVSVDGYRYRSSVWSHGEDARTYMPSPDVPVGCASGVPDQVDAKIEIVWPHGGLPVDQATKVNVGTYLFVRGTMQSVPEHWSPVVRLWRSLNNGYEEQVAIGQKVVKQVGGLTFPMWEFNDIDVSAARDPLNKYYFRVTVDGVDGRSNIWAHGADARTYFPEQDVPSGMGVCD